MLFDKRNTGEAFTPLSPVLVSESLDEIINEWISMESDIEIEESYSSIEDIVNGGYEESLFRGMSEEAGSKDAETEEGLEAEERRLEKYARNAKGKKKASYGKRIDEIEEEKKHLKESYDSIEDIVMEFKITTKQRNDLSDKYIGLVVDGKNKFPMPDEKHVSSAIGYFHTVTNPAHKKELAANINARAKALKMKIKVSRDNPFYKYASEDILED